MDLSLVIPAYNERENIQKLLLEIKKEFKKNNIKGEVIVVDDNSPDGTGEIVEEFSKKEKFVRLIKRNGKLGLSSAVLAGFEKASSEVLAVMDADLSHPVEKIGEMYRAIKDDGFDLVIGSRYIKGGKIKGWNLYRKVLSKGATLLARVFTNIKDPMTGFFMIKKQCVEGIQLNSRGFKILLEIIIKADYKKAKEIPITFTNRVKGKSKAGLNEILYYFQDLKGYLFKEKRVILEFFKFAFVGLLGTFINIIILYLLTEIAGIYYIISAVFAFIIAATNNFFLNKIWTFKEEVKHFLVKKYALFFMVSLTALIVNLFFLYIFTEFLGIYYIISQVLAIGISLIINFLGNKIWTFTKNF